LYYGGNADGGAGGGDGWRLGHEVKVEKLDELELDLAACLARLENRSYSEQPIEVFECAGVLRRVDQSADEGYDGCGLDCWTVDWLEEVEEVLFNLH
jgi:hypothetical protein